MAYDYAKLKGRIVEKVGTQRRFADLLGISEHTLSCKLNNRAAWTQSEIDRSCELLQLPPDSIVAYFFAHNVQ